MNVEKYSASQAKSMMILYMLGVTLILFGDPGAKQDTWISTIIAMLMAFVIAFVYEKILFLYPDKDIFQTLDIIYGKILGKIIVFAYLLYIVFLGTLVLRDITEYIQVVSLPETPQYISLIFLGAVSLYAVKAGIEVLFRVSKFILPLIVLVTLGSVLMSIPRFNFSYIRPILYNGWKPIFKASFQTFSFPFAEIVVFLPLLSGLKDKKDTKKVFYHSIIISGILILILTVRNILVLGFPNISLTYFPSYKASAIIQIGTFIQRLELLVSINLLIAGVSEFSVLLLASSVTLGNLFKSKDYRKYSTFLCILMCISSLIVFKNTMELFAFSPRYPYVATPFQVIIPVITLIIGAIRKKLTAKN